MKGGTARPIKPGDVIVLIGNGPSGTGMQETAQITTALKYLPWGKHVALLTDGAVLRTSRAARASGTSGPRRCDGGPIGRVRDDDLIEIVIDRGDALDGIDQSGRQRRRVALDAETCARRCCATRAPHPALAPHEQLPDDTRLWAALQRASGGTWAGCVYDVDRIVDVLDAGMRALAGSERQRQRASNETVSNGNRRRRRERRALRRAARRLGRARQPMTTYTNT